MYWTELQRQVLVEGAVERLATEESDGYWATRPRGSQLGAGARRQVSVLASAPSSRRHAGGRQRYPDEVPRPERWGGFRVSPDAVEFWQGRPDRLHDREHFLRWPPTAAGAPSGSRRSESR